MQIVCLKTSYADIVLPLGEFKSYIPLSVVDAYYRFSETDRSFNENIKDNWNLYSPQNNDYNCVITSILDDNDLPNSDSYFDYDLSRLLFLEYAYMNFAPKEYEIVRQSVENCLLNSKMLVKYSLSNPEMIDKQIKAREEYCNSILQLAKQNYDKVLSEIQQSKGG